MYGWDIMFGISKVPFEIPRKISNSYIERYDFLYNNEILRALIRVFETPPDSISITKQSLTKQCV